MCKNYFIKLFNAERSKIFILIVSVLSITQNVYGQYYPVDDSKPSNFIWCTKSLQEQYKCKNLTRAIERDRALFDDDFLNLTCLMSYSADDCVRLIYSEQAHATTLDAGDVFTAGRYHSLEPIMQEKLQGGFTNYYAVALTKKNSLPYLNNLRDLRMKRACFPWVGSLAGWIIPLYTLQRHGGMEIVDCNNLVKQASAFFNNSCAVYSLIDKYNPIGDNSDKLCALCSGKIAAGRCTAIDPYYGYDGAFRCLMEGGGEVAFLKHSTVFEMLESDEYKSVTADRFELICKDGSKMPISEYRQCNWGLVPSDAVVVSSAKSQAERKKYQKFLERVVDFYGKGRDDNSSYYGGNQNTYDNRNPNYNQYDNRNPYGNQDRNYNPNLNQYDSQNPNYNQYDNQNPNYNQYNNQNPNYNANYNTNYDNRYSTENYKYTSTESYYNSLFPRNRTRRQDEYAGYGVESRYNDFDNYFTSSTTASPLASNTTEFYEKFSIFESKRHGKIDLIFQDSTRSLARIPENDQSFSKHLKNTMDYIYGIRDCPVGRLSLCVTSEAEMEKCVKMKTALKAQILKPELICYKAHSHINCMQAISSGVSDIAVLDAGDVYTGGLQYGLVPFMAEVYNLGEPEYYVVAVGKEEDPSTELTYLKGKYTCHTGINTAAGWTYPLAYLISNGWMRPYGCDSIRAAAEYFTKSCVPGALSSEYNIGVPYDNLCDLCHGSSFRYCRRDASEEYYGHTGAFRCLVEGGGHVAFVKHTTVMESTGGRRREWWARDMLNDDFELLCPDGTRAKLPDYKICNLGKVKANAIVARGGEAYNETQLNAYINLLTYAQQLYGRKDLNEFSFSMFTSQAPYYDLIFQDATRQLRVLDRNQRKFDIYLGGNFMRARRITDCFAGANGIKSFLGISGVLLFSFIISLRSLVY